MPFALSCPNCQANFRLQDELAGRQVKCQRCGEVFRAPAAEPPVEEAIVNARLAEEPPPPRPAVRRDHDDYDDDYDSEPEGLRRRRDWDERRPPRRGTRAAERRTDPWVVVGVVGGTLLVVGSIVATVALFNAPRPQPQPIFWKGPAAFKGAGFPANPLPPLDNAKAVKIALVKGAFQGNYTFNGADPLDPVMRHPCKLFLVPLQAGKTYVIDHQTVQMAFDPFLRLENPAGQQIGADDDGGVNLNSRIQFTVGQAGTYRIIATTLRGGFGNFTLAIRDVTQPGAVPVGIVPKLDAKDAAPPGVFNGKITLSDQAAVGNFKRPGKQHVIQLEANANYRVECQSPNLKCVVYILDDTGTVLHVETKGVAQGATLFRPSVAGPHRFIVAVLPGGDGEYTLTVQKQDGKPAPPK